MDTLETAGREEERALLIAESDAVCEVCGADPKHAPEAHTLASGWFIDATLAEDGTVLASVRCPTCW